MKSPICVSKICVTNRKQTASFSIAGLLLAIAPLWLMLAFGSPANAQTSTTDTSPDWTQFHRDNMQRWNPYETVLGVNNVESLRLKWSFSVGSNPQPPAVVNGVVYIGGDEMYALNASTGAKLWSYPTYVSYMPAVVNGVVYFGSTDDNVYALNASTGALLWSYNTGNAVASSPAVANGVVYIGSGYNGYGNGGVYALNASTGAKLWSYTPGGGVQSSPAVANGVVYIGGGSNVQNVYALNANTGALVWSYATGGQVWSSPAVANGVVYIGSDDANLYALNASTGAKLWSYTTGGAAHSGPAVANGVVYFGSYDGNAYALNANTGALVWSYNTGEQVEGAPAVANGVVYVGGFENTNVYALNASTGALLWSSTAPCGTPTVVNGTVYFGPSAFGLVQPADLYLRVDAEPTPYVNGQLLTYTFRVWNLGPGNADQEVLTTQVPYPFTFDYIRISGTPGLGTCTTPAYGDTGVIVCHENSAMAPNTTWTVRLTVQLPPEIEIIPGDTITESGTVTAESPDPNLANNTATVSTTVQ